MPSCSTYEERCEDWSEEVGGGGRCVGDGGRLLPESRSTGRQRQTST